jgi:stress response protein YsnF
MAEAKVIKKLSKETKVVELELTREELIIEKRSVAKEADKSTIAPTIPQRPHHPKK